MTLHEVTIHIEWVDIVEVNVTTLIFGEVIEVEFVVVIPLMAGNKFLYQKFDRIAHFLC